MTKNAHTPLDVGSKWELRRLSHRAPEKLVSEIDRLREQNAELVKALEAIAPMFDNDSPLLIAYAAEIVQARAALAKARGEGA